MLFSANLPHRLWAEALSTAHYLWNRSPMGWLLVKIGQEKKHKLTDFESSGVKPLHTFPRTRERNWTQNPESAFSWDMEWTPKAIHCIIHSREKYFTAEMSFSMSRSVGLRSSLRLRRSHNNLFTPSIQMSPLRLLSHAYLPYTDLNMIGDSLTSMVFGVTCLISRNLSS